MSAGEPQAGAERGFPEKYPPDLCKASARGVKTLPVMNTNCHDGTRKDWYCG